jgi:hypothetical protein
MVRDRDRRIAGMTAPFAIKAGRLRHRLLMTGAGTNIVAGREKEIDLAPTRQSAFARIVFKTKLTIGSARGTFSFAESRWMTTPAGMTM